jgi:hypothetical protein
MSPFFIGVLFFLGGFLLFYAALTDRDWLFERRRSRMWVRLVGREESRKLFIVTGGLVMIVSAIGMITALAASGSGGRIGDGFIEYGEIKLYVMDRPTRYRSQVVGGGVRRYTYEEFVDGEYALPYVEFDDRTQNVNADVLALIATQPDFGTGWVLVVDDPGRGAYVVNEFVAVDSPTDWIIVEVPPSRINRPG